MKVRKASEVKAEDVDWLFPTGLKKDEDGLIPRSMPCFVAGKPEQGKGLFACHVAAKISADKTLHGGRGGKVFYSAAEDAEGLMTRPRLEAAGANLDNVRLEKFVLPRDLVEVGDYIIDNDIDLLIIDPLASHLQGVSRHSDSIRNVLNPLVKVLESAGCGLLVVEHVNKRVKAGDHPLTAIGGTGSGLPAACRMGFFFGIDPDNEEQRALACIKSNIRERPQALFFEVDTSTVRIETSKGKTIEKEMPVLIFDKEGTIDPIKLVASKGNADGKLGRPDDKRAEASEWLTRYLMEHGGGPVKASVIYEDAKAVEMMEKTLKRAANDMNIVRTKKGPATEWSLSTEVKELYEAAIKSREEGDTAVAKGPAVDKGKVKPKMHKVREDQPKQLPDVKPAKKDIVSDADVSKMMAEMGVGEDGKPKGKGK